MAMGSIVDPTMAQIYDILETVIETVKTVENIKARGTEISGIGYVGFRLSGLAEKSDKDLAQVLFNRDGLVLKYTGTIEANVYTGLVSSDWCERMEDGTVDVKHIEGKRNQLV
jgi:hypothetical protein